MQLFKVTDKLSHLGGGGWRTFRHAVALIRADKTFSTIYISGTAVAIASAMVIAIVFNMMLTDIPPEIHRSRTLYPFAYLATKTDLAQGKGMHTGFSQAAIDSCFRKMACVEAAVGMIPPTQNRFTIVGEGQTIQGQYLPPTISVAGTNPDFFRLYQLHFLSGRPFSEKEFREGDRVCVLTDKVMQKIGGGTTVDINGLPFHIVGVVKAVSAFLEDATADAYIPYMAEGLFPGVGVSYAPWSDEDDALPLSYSGNLHVRILLRKGYTMRDFVNELEPLRRNYVAIASSLTGENVEWQVHARTHFFHMISFFHPEANEDQTLALEAKNLMPPAILMLLFLLLPAINLSGLVSNRMEARRAEMGIRKAFGAKRRILLREVIRENLVLTLCGGVVGWGLSALFIAAISNNDIFLQLFVSRDQNVADTSLAFSMFFTPTLFLIVFVCCVMLNLMAALIPAWTSLRKPIVESLNQKR